VPQAINYNVDVYGSVALAGTKLVKENELKENSLILRVHTELAIDYTRCCDFVIFDL